MKQLTLQEAMNFLPLVTNGNGVALNGSFKAKSKVLYIAGLGADLAANNNNIIIQDTKKKIGLTNFDGGNKLNKGRSILITGMRILWDTTVDVTPLTALWKGEAPAAFKNGEFKVGTLAAGDLFESPINPFAKYNAATSVEDEIKPVVPFMIPEDVEFYIQLIPAAAAAVDQAYRIEFDCIEFTAANKA
ncbi:hypothetical protein [Flavobacterium sp. AG291]|uniref:hypothetical protein n=1 Tax=Flavobacterium sp. AG291 TaxID=2184000 RepID=UPI000E0A5BFC|nr:hypothetical protein [Flavobacterium sp. AG291]RDI07049.1 hypothetical protein DEU42_113149 [Flavobacterium sp. AG291]